MTSAQAKQSQGLVGSTQLQGVDRVTAVLLMVGTPLAQRIIRQFEDKDIRALAHSANGLPAVGLDVVEQIVDQLARECEDTTSGVAGSSQEAQNLLTGVVSDEEFGEIMGELNGQPPKRIWTRLSGIPDEKLAAFIAKEEQQIAAFVLSNLDADKASSIMGNLDNQLRADLSARLLLIKPINDWAARMVGDRLEREMFGGAVETRETDKYTRVGAILNKLEPEQISDVLARLQVTHPKDTQEVIKHIFYFERVIDLTPDDRARLFGEVPAERTIMALRETNQDLQTAVLSVLSPRSRRLVESELTVTAKVPRKLIVDARRAIADLALTLAEKAAISLPRCEPKPNSGDAG